MLGTKTLSRRILHLTV